MSFTNAQLAQKISDLIAYWASFNEEHANWLGGAVDGGPGGDGQFPLTDYTGQETLVKSPAKLQDDVDNITTGATAQANAAAASAAAAATSASNAATSATDAYNSELAAQAAQSVATTKEASAVNAASTAVTQANLATDRAGYAAEWANKAVGSLVSVAAGGDGVDDYSAMHWAVQAATSVGTSADDFDYNPTRGVDSSGTFGELRLGNGTFTAGDANLHIDQITGVGEANEYLLLLASSGQKRFAVQRDGDLEFYSYIQIPGGESLRWSGANTRIEGNASADITVHTHDGTQRAQFTNTGLNVTGALAATGAVTGSNLNVSNWDTAFGWGDHAGLYALKTGDTFSGGVAINHTGSQLTLFESDGADTADKWVVDFNGGALNFYFYDNSGASWHLPLKLRADASLDLDGVNINAGTVGNWNTAYGWGNHAGLYEVVDASLVRSGTLTQEDNFTYLNRNNAGNPVLHVAQVGAGPIAKFGKVASLGSTGYTAEIVFNNNGSITAEGLYSNDVLEAARINIVGGTSGNTHFNWSSGGENYITHKTAEFTKFRSYDGVSTYTDKAEINDSKVLLTGIGIETNHSGTKNFPVLYTSSGASTTIRSGNYATWGNSYSEQASFMANNCYMDPADAANQYRYMNTHATYGHSIYKQYNGQHRWYGDTASVTAGAIVSEQLLALLYESSNIANLELGVYANTIGGQLKLHGTTANKTSTLTTTNGNLHIDSHAGSQVYLNYYSNTGGVYIGAAGGFKSTLTGQYGAVQTQGSTGGYGGISLDGYFAFMNSGSSHCGIYNDVNNQWFILAYPNSWMQFYNAGTAVMRTSSTGMIHPSAGAYYRNNSSSYLSGAVTFSTGARTGGSSGDIWFQYT